MLKPELKYGRIILGIAAILIFFIQDATAQGNLLVTPRRVVFEGNRRVMDINLANTGTDTARYNISMIQYRMTEDGSFVEITEPDPGQNFADQNIRFFPRSVTLAPNEAQVIKMQVSNTQRLQPGEYRSHAYFRAVPNAVALGSEQTDTDTTAVSIQLIPIFGISIPVIIRVGESTTRVSLSDITLNKIEDKDILNLTFNRAGNMSVYGDLKINYISPAGRETNIANVNGISVYTPNKIRYLRVELPKESGVDLTKGRLKITYSAQSDIRPEVYAEAELLLN